MLTVTITNLKEGTLLRNGLPRSSLATLTEHWIRHGDFLTVAIVTNDPVYLTEPLMRTIDFELDVHQRMSPYSRIPFRAFPNNVSLSPRL